MKNFIRKIQEFLEPRRDKGENAEVRSFSAEVGRQFVELKEKGLSISVFTL